MAGVRIRLLCLLGFAACHSSTGGEPAEGDRDSAEETRGDIVADDGRETESPVDGHDGEVEIVPDDGLLDEGVPDDGLLDEGVPDAAPWCGDGIVGPDEECDDGNGVSGDGCEPDCVFSCHPGVDECPDDGIPCTQEVCGSVPAGYACVVTPFDGPCEDGNPCTGPDVCIDAICRAGHSVPRWFRDNDGDTFGVRDEQICAPERPDGYVGTAGDCCDADPNVRPDQLAYFPVAYLCGTGGAPSWDYDCDGLYEPSWEAGCGECVLSGSDCTAIPGWAPAAGPCWPGPGCGGTTNWLEACAWAGTACSPSVYAARTQECR